MVLNTLPKFIELGDKMKVFKPPVWPIVSMDENVVFLAGSIEMGAAEDWQTKVVKAVEEHDGVILNPRRDDWDSSWEQSIKNPQFKEQVEWELYGLDIATLVFMYFDPNTKSPISLLELGLCARDKKMCVVCPTGFWRKGNVDIVCAKENIPVFEDLNQGIIFLKHHCRVFNSERLYEK